MFHNPFPILSPGNHITFFNKRGEALPLEYIVVLVEKTLASTDDARQICNDLG